MRSFVPFDSPDVISPGTAKTSRPSSSAKSAVMSAPERSRPRRPRSPAQVRRRCGSGPESATAPARPGGYSETTSAAVGDPARELRVRTRIVAVDPAAEHRDRQAAGGERSRCASPSIPRASPLTTTTPAAASSRGEIARHLSSVARAAACPTIATAGRERISTGLRAGRGAPADRGARRAAAGTPLGPSRPTRTSRRELGRRPCRRAPRRRAGARSPPRRRAPRPSPRPGGPARVRAPTEAGVDRPRQQRTRLRS